MLESHLTSYQRRDARLNLMAAFLGFFYLLGSQTVLMPVLFPSIIAEMGWSRGEATTYSSVKYFAGGISAFFGGFLIDRFGLKRILLIALTAKALVLTFFLVVDGLPGYYLIGLINGATGVIAVVAFHTLVAQWYVSGQGRAHGVALVGSALAGILMPIIAQNLLGYVGWRAVVVSVNLILWGLLLPLLWFVVKPGPDSGVESSNLFQSSIPIAQLPRQSAFWIVMFILVIVGFAQEGLHQHTKTYLELDLGYSGEFAAAVLSAIMLISIAGRVGFGWVYDRWSLSGISACYLTLAVSAVIAGWIGGILLLCMFVLFRGLSQGGVMVDAPVLITHMYGRENLPRLLGIAMGVSSLGMAISPAFFGHVHDLTGSYTIPFVTTAVVAVVAAVLVLRQRPVAQVNELTNPQAPGEKAAD